MAGYEILLLDDGSEIFTKLAWVLRHEGFQVTLESEELAYNPLDLDIGNFDLLIARVILPFAELKALFGEFKKLNPYGAIIVLSEDYDYTFPVEAYQLEINDYIIMPGFVWELWRRIKNCLDEIKLNYLKALFDEPVSEFNMRAFKLLQSSPYVRLSFLAEVKTRFLGYREFQKGLLFGHTYLS